jgi:hypothetical protein
MRHKEWTFTPIDADADGISTLASTAGAESITFNGALILDGLFTSDSVEDGPTLSRKIGITSSGDDTGITFALVGTDPDGKAQTESVTGLNGDVAESEKYWETLISVTTSGATTGGITVGTVDEFASGTMAIETHNSDPATVSLERFTGTINVTVQESFSRIQYTDSIQWSDGPTALQTATSAAVDDMSNHASGLRLKCNSYSSGAALRMVVNQNRQY